MAAGMTEPPQRTDAFGRPVRETPPTPPRPLLLARRVWIASVLVGFVHSFVKLADRTSLIEELHRIQPQLDQVQLDSAANSGIMFTLVFSLLSLAVYVLLSNRMVQGHNWARVVLTVFGGLSSFFTLISLVTVSMLGSELITRLTGTSPGAVDMGFSAVVMVLEVAALVLMYRPESNRYFTAVRSRVAAGQRPS